MPPGTFVSDGILLYNGTPINLGVLYNKVTAALRKDCGCYEFKDE